MIAIGVISEEQLNGILNRAPQAPGSIAETDVTKGTLRNLLLKVAFSMELQTPSQMADVLKLPPRVVQSLVEKCMSLKLMEVLGSAGSGGGCWWLPC